jgi:hypothetical protein
MFVPLCRISGKYHLKRLTIVNHPKRLLTLNPKDIPMLYKTITLELLQQLLETYDRLTWKRNLLVTLDHYASELRTRRLAWKEVRTRPEAEASETASELALKELQELFSDLRDQLKAGLSATAPESVNGKGLTVSALAEGIKALKAAHTIDPTPQRAQQKQSTAEEPITTRIRRRQEANSEAGPPADPHDGLEAENCLPARVGESASPKALISFRERITLERQRQDDGPSLP